MKFAFTFLIALALIIPGWPRLCFFNFLPEIQEASAAITVGTPSTNSCSNCPSLTISSHSISGSDPLVLVGVNLNDGPSTVTVNTVTYSGIPLTQLVDLGGTGNKTRSEIWYLAPASNPSDGSYNVFIDIDGTNTNDISAGVITFNGVDQTTPVDGKVESSGKAINDTLNVTSGSGDLVMDIVTYHNTTITPDVSQTEQWNLELGGTGISGFFGGASTKDGAASVDMVYTFNASNKNFSHAAFNINAPAATRASPPPPPFRPNQRPRSNVKSRPRSSRSQGRR